MQVLISDANILIDMEEGELIEEMFRLPYVFSIPDILFYEEMEEEHQNLISLGLGLEDLSGDIMTYGLELTELYRKPSRNDCLALALAKLKECPLLTGDRDLRIAAEQEAVEVMGTIWLVTQLVSIGIIDCTTARESYERMRLSGRRLPWIAAEAKLLEIEQM